MRCSFGGENWLHSELGCLVATFLFSGGCFFVCETAEYFHLTNKVMLPSVMLENFI